MIYDTIKYGIGWIKENSLNIGVWIYEHLLAIINKKNKEIDMANLNTKKLENKLEVEKQNSGKSDSDIISDAISEGRKK